MNKLRDSRGSFVKNLVKPPHSPSSSSETSYETESSNNHSEPHNMEGIDNPLIIMIHHLIIANLIILCMVIGLRKIIYNLLG